MRNEVIFDDRGRPDILVVFTPDELKLPDTLKGRKVKEYAISKYPNTMIDGRPYSLPFMPPAVNVNHDEAIRLCEAKGPGWHLITNDEWAALARQSWENDTVPTGNTNSGKSHSHPEQKGTTYQNSYGKTLTGSGPIEWNHDRTAEGVADMVGNVWEHVGGVRFLNGQVQIIPNNEAAAGADQSPDSKEWTAIYTPDGDPVYYNVKDGEIVLQPTAPDGKDYDGVPFCDLHERADMDVPDKLIELGLYPAPDYESEEYFWLDTDGERCVFRGGLWGSGTSAGVFCLNGGNSRSHGRHAPRLPLRFSPVLWRLWRSGSSGRRRETEPERQSRKLALPSAGHAAGSREAHAHQSADGDLHSRRRQGSTHIRENGIQRQRRRNQGDAADRFTAGTAQHSSQRHEAGVRADKARHDNLDHDQKGGRP